MGSTLTKKILPLRDQIINNKLKFICWNIQGMTDKLFDEDVPKMLFENDIVMLSETHTSKLSEKMYCNVIAE